MALSSLFSRAFDVTDLGCCLLPLITHACHYRHEMTAFQRAYAVSSALPRASRFFRCASLILPFIHMAPSKIGRAEVAEHLPADSAGSSIGTGSSVSRAVPNRGKHDGAESIVKIQSTDIRYGQLAAPYHVKGFGIYILHASILRRT